MKITSKILGVLIILVIGIGFLFYGNLNRSFSKAERAYTHGDFEQAELLYKKGVDNLKRLSFFRIRFFKKELEKIELARAWSFYYQGYYEPEKYELAKEIINKELDKGSSQRDQLHNLKALIFWQKGVELFVKMGKKAANSKELEELLDKAIDGSGKAVKENNGEDWDIKYNYEFFRRQKEKAKQNMQQQANQKQEKDKKTKEQTEQAAKERQEQEKQQKEQEEQQGAQQKKVEKGKEEQVRPELLVPKDEQKNTKEEPTTGSSEKKKKKKK